MLVLFYLTRNHIREPFILSGHARVMSQINVVLPTTIHLPIELHRLGDSVQIAVRNTEPWWYLRSECLTTFLSWFTAIDSAHAHAAACFPWSGFFFFFWPHSLRIQQLDGEWAVSPIRSDLSQKRSTCGSIPRWKMQFINSEIHSLLEKKVNSFQLMG